MVSAFRRYLRCLGFFAGIWAFCLASAQALPPGVSQVFSQVQIDEPQLSPDGTRLIFVRRGQPGDKNQDQDEVLVVDYTELTAPRARVLPMSDLTVRWAAWANDNRLLVSWLIDTEIEGGVSVIDWERREINFITSVDRSVLVSINLDGSDVVELLGDQRGQRMTLWQTVGDQVVDFLPQDPQHILVADRNARHGYLNVLRVNVNTGEGRRVDRGAARSFAWYTNSAGETVMRLDHVQNLERVNVLIREGDGRRWRRVSTQNISRFSEFQDGVNWAARAEAFDEAYVLTRANGSDTLGLHRYSLSSGEVIEPVFEHPEYDVGGVRVDPFTGRPLALSWSGEQTFIEVFDEEIDRHLTPLREFFGNDVVVEPMQKAGTRILLRVFGPTEPTSYYLYDTEAFNVVPIGARQPALQGTALASVSVHHYTARDGTELFGYLTHPANPRDGTPPLVVLPHGGPEIRDYHRFDAIAQLIAAEGFMVFQPQFRGSAGFGRAFQEAGHGEWDGRIQHDITDGVRSVLDNGLAHPQRVCVAGWSFGGYAALMQAIMEPGLYQCAAAGAAVTDLPVMLAGNEPVTNLPEILARRAADLDGDVDPLARMMGAESLDELEAASPSHRADELTIPVILIHGAQDRIVPVEQSRIMNEAMEAAGAEVHFIEYRGGHAMDDPDEMRTAIFHITSFLRDHLDPE